MTYNEVNKGLLTVTDMSALDFKHTEEKIMFQSHSDQSDSLSLGFSKFGD